MTDPVAHPGDEVWLRTSTGGVLGPFRVERVEVHLNVSGRYDRFRFAFSPLWPCSLGVDGEKVFRSRAEALRGR